MKIQVTVEVPDVSCYGCDYSTIRDLGVRCLVFSEYCRDGFPCPACIQARKLAGEEGKG